MALEKSSLPRKSSSGLLEVRSVLKRGAFEIGEEACGGPKGFRPPRNVGSGPWLQAGYGGAAGGTRG